ncbi:ComF family protein [Novosphingobium aquimarinum]|uniref:ComF family protein n=1 Tax=Novosphingobium aquimarinum TaxID=2682494 RepID=UPI001E5E6174|nr:ComF family protein [Novosphingobium aquimarinum]
MSLLSPIVDKVLPPRCPLCGDGISAQTGLCSACWNKLVIPGEPACKLCQRPFDEDEVGEDAVCAPCLAKAPQHDGVAAATLYNEASKQLVLALKHGNRIALAPMMAHQIAAKLPMLKPGTLIVPVPLHRARLWSRGYNQAAILGEELARLTGMMLVVDGLLRRKSTPFLGNLDRRSRSSALSGAITVNPSRREMIKGANVVLVDDVLTSGATSNACVSALKRRGAQSVVIACYARVLDEVF